MSLGRRVYLLLLVLSSSFFQLIDLYLLGSDMALMYLCQRKLENIFLLVIFRGKFFEYVCFLHEIFSSRYGFKRVCSADYHSEDFGVFFSIAIIAGTFWA